MIEPELVGRKEHTSGASHLAVPENLRPPLCEEEAVGICKRVKRIHDPVKFVVPYEVFEAESPIPQDKNNCPAEVPSSDINRIKSIDTIISSSIDTGHISSIDTLRESAQKEFEAKLEEEEKDQGRSSVIIDSPLLRRCQKIQSAQQMLLTAFCKAQSLLLK
ncbi:BnaAnng02050D [Brassica napus]|uniref:BnaAnng02050D protein n=1 Tax=Brassica napus TaxID=3708 RepID=A0A078FCE2_BRANA|nr:BnaAnng02050D [Brassica napus]